MMRPLLFVIIFASYCSGSPRSDLALAEFEKAERLLVSNPQQALAHLDKAIGHDSAFPQAYHRRGLIYEKLGKPDIALDNFNKAVDTAPSNKESIYVYERARFYHRQKMYLEAEADYKRAIENSAMDPNRPYYYLNYALLLEDTGRYIEALDKYAIVLDMSPTPEVRKSIEVKISEVSSKIKR